MSTSWVVTTAPIIEPIDATEAKLHARIVQSTEDSLVTSYIKAAREAAEEAMNRGLLTQTLQLVRQDFADEMYLPRAAPLQNTGQVVPVVTYYDANGGLQTLASTFYDVDTTSRPGRLTRAAGKTWPSLHSDRTSGRVFISYVVGWTTAALVPERIKQGIRMYVAYLACDREGMETDGQKALQAAHSCWMDKVEWIDTCPA